jgi:hypothetical protein
VLPEDELRTHKSSDPLAFAARAIRGRAEDAQVLVLPEDEPRTNKTSDPLAFAVANLSPDTRDP